MQILNQRAQHPDGNTTEERPGPRDGLDDRRRRTIRDIEGDSAQCPNPADTRITTEITVAAADLGNVLALLPTASDSIDLDGAFGVVSLGNRLDFV